MNAAAALVLKVLALTHETVLCDHQDESKWELITGNVLHCACGVSFKVPCQHKRVEQWLPRVLRCMDCHEWRSGGVAE